MSTIRQIAARQVIAPPGVPLLIKWVIKRDVCDCHVGFGVRLDRKEPDTTRPGEFRFEWATCAYPCSEHTLGPYMEAHLASIGAPEYADADAKDVIALLLDRHPG